MYIFFTKLIQLFSEYHHQSKNKNFSPLLSTHFFASTFLSFLSLSLSLSLIFSLFSRFWRLTALCFDWEMAQLTNADWLRNISRIELFSIHFSTDQNCSEKLIRNDGSWGIWVSSHGNLCESESGLGLIWMGSFFSLFEFEDYRFEKKMVKIYFLSFCLS